MLLTNVFRMMWVVFIFWAAAIISSAPAGMMISHQGDPVLTITSRKLMGNGDDKVNLQDYNPIDPVPSYKTSIRPGPIQHGTPLNPYVVPKPTPPSGPDPAHPNSNGGPN